MSTGLDFASFYAAARPTLLRTTYAVTGDRQLAEDAVQVAFAKAYAVWGRVARADDPTAYVRRIAINAALGHRRRASFRREGPSGPTAGCWSSAGSTTRPATRTRPGSPPRPGSGAPERCHAAGTLGDVIELSKGQEMQLPSDGGVLRMGLGWDKNPSAGPFSSGTRDVDLDASAVEFGGGQLFDLAFYNNRTTRDGSVEHLGDNTTGSGTGDDETITVDLARVHRQIDTIFLLVTSYQGHSLEWVANAYCRVVDVEGTELARITLTLGVPETGVVMARIARDGEGWVLRAVAKGIAVTLPSESGLKLRAFL